MVGGARVPLGSAYAPQSGRVQIGIRPEYAEMTASDGVPVRVLRVEDVGRHRIVRAEAAGSALNVILPEGAALGTDMTHVRFQPDKVNVYVNDWRVAPIAGGAAL